MRPPPEKEGNDMKKIRLVLTNAENNVLDKIARKSKMDTWFSVMGHRENDGTESDWVYDIENGRRVTLRYGVDMLHQGMTFYADYDMTKREIATFEGLLKKLGLKEDRHLSDTPRFGNKI